MPSRRGRKEVNATVDAHQPCRLLELPPEIIVHIGRSAEHADFVTLSSTCRFLRSLLLKEAFCSTHGFYTAPREAYGCWDAFLRVSKQLDPSTTLMTLSDLPPKGKLPAGVLRSIVGLRMSYLPYVFLDRLRELLATCPNLTTLAFDRVTGVHPLPAMDARNITSLTMGALNGWSPETFADEARDGVWKSQFWVRFAALGWPALRELVIGVKSFTREGFEELLADMPLEKLRKFSLAVYDPGMLAHISRMRQLRSLHLCLYYDKAYKPDNVDIIIQVLSPLRKLASLHIEGQVNDDEIAFGTDYYTNARGSMDELSDHCLIKWPADAKVRSPLDQACQEVYNDRQAIVEWLGGALPSLKSLVWTNAIGFYAMRGWEDEGGKYERSEAGDWAVRERRPWPVASSAEVEETYQVELSEFWKDWLKACKDEWVKNGRELPLTQAI